MGRHQLRGWWFARGRYLHLGQPAARRRLGPDNEANALAVAGRYAYVADRGLNVIDINTPANPQRVGGNSSFAAFVAAGAQGLIILHTYGPIRFGHAAREGNGPVRLQISGPPNVPGRVQRSVNLLNWTDWLPVNFGESPIEVSDPEASPVRFYRIAAP